MEALHLDTHILAWMWEGSAARLSRIDRHLRRRCPAVSPMVIMELQLLHEIGRIEHSAEHILKSLRSKIDLTVCGQEFAAVVAAAAELSWTRDPFDRLIVATAKLERAPLLTADERILGGYRRAIEY